METYDDLTPAQRRATEALVQEAYARHRSRCEGVTDRGLISDSHAVLADELRDAYVVGRRAKDDPPVEE